MTWAKLVGGALVLTLVGTVRASTPEAGRPPEHLRETGLYTLGRLFSPQYPLWSDGADKTRWVYLPPGTTIDATDPTNWNLPIGTRFWKEFRFGGAKVETRLLWKVSATRWTAASYVWNEDGTDAVLAPDEGVLSTAEVAPGRRHLIPSRQECLMCHGTSPVQPLGFNLLQLSSDRDPNALHREELRPGMVTLQTLLDEGRITGARPGTLPTDARVRTRHPETRAVLGYLFANCGSCHNGSGEIAALAPVLKMPELLADADRVAAAMLRQPTSWQVPGVPEGSSLLIDGGEPDRSALLTRMRSRRPSTQMPPLGTLKRDNEAVHAVRRWIELSQARYTNP